MRAPVQGARIAVCGRVRKKGERKRGVCADCAVDERVRKQFYSSAVRGRMETQSAGSFQLRWQPLGDSMGIAPKLQGRGRARSSVHGGSVSVLYLFWEMNLRTH